MKMFYRYDELFFFNFYLEGSPQDIQNTVCVCDVKALHLDRLGDIRRNQIFILFMKAYRYVRLGMDI